MTAAPADMLWTDADSVIVPEAIHAAYCGDCPHRRVRPRLSLDRKPIDCVRVPLWVFEIGVMNKWDPDTDALVHRALAGKRAAVEAEVQARAAERALRDSRHLS